MGRRLWNSLSSAEMEAAVGCLLLSTPALMGKWSLSRRVVDELDPILAYEGTVEVELANGAVMEEDVYRGRVRFNGQELDAEIIITDVEDTFIGTGLLTGKVLLINFATREVIIRDHTNTVRHEIC